MPTYDYECDACGHKFEHFQSMSSKLLRKCPECAKRKLRRLIGSGAGVIFKGSGFYETDYKRKGSSSSSTSSSSESSETTTSSSEKSTKKSDTSTSSSKKDA